MWDQILATAGKTSEFSVFKSGLVLTEDMKSPFKKGDFMPKTLGIMRPKAIHTVGVVQ